MDRQGAIMNDEEKAKFAQRLYDSTHGKRPAPAPRVVTESYDVDYLGGSECNLTFRMLEAHNFAQLIAANPGAKLVLTVSYAD